MALHEHGRVERHLQLLAQLGHALRLVLAAAVGEQDERDALALEVRERLVRARERVGAAEEDAIDAAAPLAVIQPPRTRRHGRRVVLTRTSRCLWEKRGSSAMADG